MTRYQDSAFRTKIEAQFGVGSFDAGNQGLASTNDTITDLAVTEASLRHYQHEWNTQRDIARHQVTYRQTLDSGLFELRAYQGSWENSSQWLPWNFLTPDVISRTQQMTLIFRQYHYLTAAHLSIRHKRSSEITDT